MRNTSLFLNFCYALALQAAAQANEEPIKLFENHGQIFHEDIPEGIYLSMNPNALNWILDNKPAQLQIEIPAPQGNGTWTLNLEKTNIIEENFRVSTSDGSVIDKSEFINNSVFYRGQINQSSANFASLSFFREKLMGVIATQNGNYDLGPFTSSNNNIYVLYNSKKLSSQLPFVCNSHIPDTVFTPFSNLSIAPFIGGLFCDRVPHIYFECDYQMFLDNSSSVINVVNFVNGLFNVVDMIYNNDGMDLAISEIFVWTTPDPYMSLTTATAYLNNFTNNVPNFNGNLAHLLSTRNLNLGGYAWIDVLCGNTNRHAFSNIFNNYQSFPVYSGSVHIVAHELGHNIGSPHTHSCSWPGGAIDNCWPVEDGTCPPGPPPVNGGTIMSYCHTTSYGINFLNGFGLLPRNLMRQKIDVASCLPLAPGSVTIPLGCTPTTSNPFNNSQMGPRKVILRNINSTTKGADVGVFTDLSCRLGDTLTKGVSYNINVETKLNVQNVRAFIDFNNNQIFEASEIILQSNGPLSSPDYTHSGTFTVPQTAISNVPYRMRVVADWYVNNNPAPCGTLIYGQAEDYAIYVINPNIFTGNVASPLCGGAAVQIPFTTFGDFNQGNVFTAQLSDPNGDFSSPTNLGSISGTTSSIISATIPSGLPYGTGYKIRVVSSSPPVVGTISNSNLTIGIPAIISPSSDTICLGESITLTASGGTSYSWNNGSSGPSITVSPSVTTSYSVTVTGPNSCTGTATATIWVLTLPSANFTFSVVGNNVNFSNASQNANFFSWDFGDGSSAVDANPVHTYGSGGIYNVCLTASNSCGSVTTCQSIQVQSSMGIVPDSIKVSGNFINIYYPSGLGSINNLSTDKISVVAEATGYKYGNVSQQGNMVVFEVLGTPIRAGEMVHVTIEGGMTSSSGHVLLAYNKILYSPAQGPSCGIFEIVSTGLKFPSPADFMRIDLADFNKDNLMDIVCTYQQSFTSPFNIAVYLANGQGGFHPPTIYTDTSPGLTVRFGGTLDFNNDGYPDLSAAYLVPPQVGVWLNDGTGHFSLLPTVYPILDMADWVDFADVNNDGFIDMVGHTSTPNLSNNRIYVLLNNGDGTFDTPVYYLNGSTFGAGTKPIDLNVDGWQDIFYASYYWYGSQMTFQTFENDGTGLFSNSSVLPNPNGYHILATADFNNDDIMDVLMTIYGSTIISYGDGMGGFSSSYSLGSYGAFHQSCADVNGDGWMDVVVKLLAIGTSPYFVHYNNGDGTFTTFYGTGGEALIASPKVIDINSDEAVDYVFVALNDSIYLARNKIIQPTQLNQISCGSFTWPLNGQTYTQSGSFFTYLTSSEGCDSLIVLNLTIIPPSPEICNLLDDDCDGLVDDQDPSVAGTQAFYQDADGDGFGNPAASVQACSAPAGYVSNNSDCDDNKFSVNPNAPEILNGIDDDCDGLVDEGTVSLSPTIGSNEVVIFPNPFSDNLNVMINFSNLSGIILYMISDVTGRILEHGFKTETSFQVGNNLSKGTYTLILQSGDWKISKKVIKF